MADDVKRVGLVFSADGTVDFKKSLSEVNDAVAKNRSEFKLAKAQWDESTSSAKKLQDQQKYLTAQTEAYTDKVKTLELKLAELSKDEDANADAIKKTEIQLNQAKATLANYEKGLEEVNKELTTGAKQMQEYADKVKDAGEKMEAAGSAITKGVTAPIIAAGAASAKMASEFEDAVAKVNTIADSSEMSIDELKKQILALSDETGIAATDIAENVYNAISAGQKTGDAVNFVANAAKLAKAGFADSASALDVLTTILNAYGLASDKVTDVSDMLITTQNEGKTTVADLSATMGKVIPTANSYGVALDQLTASYAILTKNGVQTKIATTYVNALLGELGKNGTKASKIISEKTNKSLKELMAEGKSLSEVLEIVNKGAKEQNLSLTDMFGSAEAAKAALLLLGDSTEDFNEMLTKMRNSTGATDSAFEKLDTTSKKVNVTVNKLKNAATDMGGAVLKVVTPALDKGAKKVSELTEKFSSLTETKKKNIVKWGLLVAAIGPAVLVIGKLTSGIGSLMSVMSTLATTLSISTGAVGALMVAIVAITAAIVAWKIQSEKARAEIRELQDRVEETTEKVNANKEAWDSVKDAQQNYLNSSMTEMSTYESLWAELQKIVDENGKVKEGYEKRASFITTTLSEALGIEITDIDGVIQKYKEIQGEIDNVIAKKKAEIILDSQKGNYEAAINGRTEALKNLQKAEDEIADAKSQIADQEEILAEKTKKLEEERERVQKSGDRSGGYIQAYQNEVNAVENNIATLKKSLETSRNNYATQRDIIEQYAYSVGQYERNMELAHAGEYDKMSTVNWEYVKDYQAAGDAEKAQLEDQIAVTTEHLQILLNLKKQSGNDLYDQQIADDKRELEELNEHLKKYQSTTEEELKNAKLKWSTGLAEQLSEITGKKVEFQNAGRNQVQMYVDGVAQGEPQSKQTMATLIENTILEVSKQETNATTAGENLIEGINKGIGNETKQKGVFSTIADFGAKLLNKLKNAFQEHSPSKATEQMGEYLLEGLNKGIDEKKKDTLKKVVDFGEDVVSTLDNELDNPIELGEVSVKTNRQYAPQNVEVLRAVIAEVFSLYKDNLNIEVPIDLTIPVTSKIGDDTLETQIIKIERKMLIKGGGKK